MIIRKMNRIISLMFLLMSTVFMIASALPMNKTQADSNVAAWILCASDDGKKLYNAATTDVVPFNIRSKSNGASTDDIDSFYNQVLSAAGFKFADVNKAILGRSVVPDVDKTQKDDSSSEDTTDDSSKKAADPNKKAARVNPFDRFGVAGLNWSSYSGEWKYYKVDGCSSNNDVSKTEFGKFYANRKEPKTTYDGVDNSLDPRTEQFSRGTFTSWTAAFNDLIANMIFSIAKGVVTLTIALISLAFTDITTVIGLNSANANGFVGIFTNLYTGVFEPLIVFMMVLTAFYILWVGIAKRQVRTALVNGLGGALACLLLGTIIATKPDFWVPLPNKAATYGEAVIVNALSKGERGSEGWCDTNVADTNKRSINTEASTDEKQSQMEAVGKDMKSVIGCRMWEEYLLRPWSQGQYGVNYTELDAGKIKNHNSEWVGSPSVPLGGGKVVKNWALFQLSTQTTAHAQLGEDGKLATDPKQNIINRVDGVSTDWYRVVDALSNYDEKDTDTLENTTASSKEAADNQITSLKPMSVWQTWIGNHSSDRYGTAVMAVVFAVLGAIGPLVFAMMAAIYSVGTTLLMAVSPVFFLMGSWAGNGAQIFKGWLADLIQVMIKKVVATAMIMLSFTITMSGMDLMDQIGWIRSVILVLVSTVVMIKSRHQIMDVFTKMNFGSATSPAKHFGAVTKKFSNGAANSAMAVGGLAYGAYKGKQTGMGMMKGVRLSANQQMEQLARRSTLGRSAMYSYKQTAADSNSDPITCSKCGRSISPGDNAYRDEDGNYICFACGEEMGTPDDLYAIKAPTADGSKLRKGVIRRRQNRLEKQGLFSRPDPNPENRPQLVNPNNTSKAPAFDKYYGTQNKSWLSYSTMAQRIEVTDNGHGHFTWNKEGASKMASGNIQALNTDIKQYQSSYAQYGNQVMAPSVPEPLTDYLDMTALNAAWRQNRYDVIKESYITAWINWYDDNVAELDGIDESDRDEFIAALYAAEE